MSRDQLPCRSPRTNRTLVTAGFGALMALALLHPLNRAVHSSKLHRIIRATRLSMGGDPVRVPRTWDNDPNKGVFLACKAADGTWRRHKWDARLWSGIGGAHPFKLFLRDRFTVPQSEIELSDSRRHTWQWLLCADDSDLHRLLDCGVHSSAFRVEIRQLRRNNRSGVWDGTCT